VPGKAETYGSPGAHAEEEDRGTVQYYEWQWHGEPVSSSTGFRYA